MEASIASYDAHHTVASYLFPLFNCDGCVSGWDVLIKRVQLTSVIPFINLHLYIHLNAYSHAPRHDPHDTPPSGHITIQR
jgi:hypothetical protein